MQYLSKQLLCGVVTCTSYFRRLHNIWIVGSQFCSYCDVVRCFLLRVKCDVLLRPPDVCLYILLVFFFLSFFLSFFDIQILLPTPLIGASSEVYQGFDPRTNS